MRIVQMIESPALRDVEGRPLREGRTPREFLRPDDIEYKACPYSGARTGKPRNASALRQMGAHWDEACGLLASLRAAHDRVLGVTHPRLMDVWRVSQLGSALPWWHLFREGSATRALEQVFAGIALAVERGFGGQGAPPLDRIVSRRHAELANPPNAPAG